MSGGKDENSRDRLDFLTVQTVSRMLVLSRTSVDTEAWSRRYHFQVSQTCLPGALRKRFYAMFLSAASIQPARGTSGPVAVAAQPHPANPQAASRRERGTSGDPPPPRERGHFLLFTSEARQYTSTYTEVSERRVRGKRVAHRGKQAQASSRCFTYLLVECVCLLVH